MSLLRQNGLEAERNTRIMRNDFLKPLPWKYCTEYKKYLHINGLNDSATSVHQWALLKLEEVIQVFEIKGQQNEKPKIDNSKSNAVLVNTDQIDQSSKETSNDLITFELDDQTSESNDIDEHQDDGEEEETWSCMLTTNKDIDKFCPLCSTPNNIIKHDIDSCTAMKALPINSRRTIFMFLNLCFRCALKNHSAKDCPTKSTCTKCKGSHHLLLHFPKRDDAKPAGN